MINKCNENLITNSVLKIDIRNIINRAKKVNNKCLVKKNNNLLSNLSPARDEVDEKEKNKPKKNKIKKLNKIFLSIFLSNL